MKAIGIDVGGTKIAAGLLDVDDGVILRRAVRPTNPERGGPAILKDVLDLVESMRVDAGAVGIGVAELVDRGGNIVSNATLGWKDLRVREQLSRVLPTRIEADVRAAARAEARFGAGQGIESFLYLTIGTGISCCLMQQGQPHFGARGLSGTFASAPTLAPFVDYRLERCVPLEEFSSGPGLARRYALKTNQNIDAREVTFRAANGDVAARQIVETGGRAVGSAIAQLVNTLDPQNVVIGGGLGCAGGIFFAALKTAFYQHLWSDLHSEVPLKIAKLGPDAGLIGAALAASD